MSGRDRQARALARSQRATLTKTTLAGETDPDPIDGAEAVSLLTRLSLESHRLAQLPEPTYTRAQIPVRFVPSRLT
jgi:hypothetical protein